MAFKAAFVVIAPDSDPKSHRATIKTPKIEITTVLVPMMNVDLAIAVCRDLVKNEGVHSLTLCPGFTHEAVARVADAVGGGVAIDVARGDVPSTIATGEILRREGWFPEGH